MNLDSAKTVATLAAPFTPFINAVVQSHITPKLQKIFEERTTGSKINAELARIDIERPKARFREYFTRSVEEHGFVNSIVFRGMPKLLYDLYIPMTLTPNSNRPQIKCDSFKGDVLLPYRRILIKDTAGMGKSTVLKFLFLECIKNNIIAPIFIELRNLRVNKDVVSLIHEELSSHEKEFDKDILMAMITRGYFILFLDGFDEIPFEDRDEIISDLQAFIKKASNNYFIMSSRPEASLGSFNNFHEFNLNPFSKSEAYSLITRYDMSPNKEKSTELISYIESDERSNEIQSFLQNPLLISYLYKSYDFKADIPLKKHEFYYQVYTALYDEHDLSKNPVLRRSKRSGLSLTDFHKWLKYLGINTFLTKLYDFSPEEFMEQIKKSREKCGLLSTSDLDLKDDVTVAVPLIIQEGKGVYYRWAHNSIQEYFAADYIRSETENRRDALKRILNRPDWVRFMNIFDIYYEMDAKSFRSAIVLGLLEKLAEHEASSYQAEDYEGISSESLDERRKISFYRKGVFFPANIVRDLSASVDTSVDMLSMARELLGLTTSDVTDTYYDMDTTNGAYVIFNTTNEYLARLIKRKGISSTEIVKTSHLMRRRDNIRVLQSVHKICSSFAPVIIDNIPTSLANGPAVFDLVTEFLKAADATCFEPHASIHLRQQIEKEVQRDSDDIL